MSKYVMDKESASDELQRWFDGWAMEFEEDDFSAEERKDFDAQIKNFTNAIMRGRLAYDIDSKKIEYTLRCPIESDNPLTKVEIPMPKGTALMEMDSYKDGQDMKKSFSIVGALVGKPISIIRKMDERDIMFILGINTLFLAS